MDKAYGFLLEKTSKRLKQELQRRFNELDIQMTVDQWMIFYELLLHKKLTQNEIAEFTNKDAPTVTRMIALLENRRLVKKTNDTKDKRKSLISLSSAGQKLVEKMLPVVTDFRQEGWHGLTEEDALTFERIMEKINNNLS